MKKNKTQKLVLLALLTAVSIILLYVPFLHFPLLVPYLEYDAMDVPILIGGFLLGPGAGMAIVLVSAVIQGITVSAASGIYGILMHFIATSAFMLTASMIYRNKKTTASLLIGLICGTLAMTLIMIPANLIVTPYFLGYPVSAVAELILPVIIPFNLLKAGINSAVTFLIFLPLSKSKLMKI